MKFFIWCLFFVYVFDNANGGGKKGSKHDILKVHVPEIIKHQYHTHYVFIHKHEPKKAPKKEVKHHHKHIHIPDHGHHHKHWFGVHSVEHSHSGKKPTYKIRTVSKVPHVHTFSHKTHPSHKHTTPSHHKPKLHPIPSHKPKFIPEPHHEVNHYHYSHPIKYDTINYDPKPPSTSYQVTENYDPEAEVLNGFHPNDYSVPGDLSHPPIGDSHQNKVNYQGDNPVQYNSGFFTYPSPPGHYDNSNPSLSSYDISPYHEVERPKHEHNQEQFDYFQGHSEEEGTHDYSDDQGQDVGYQGDYEFDYQPNIDNNDFTFQHNGFDDVSHVGHTSDVFGENVPGYTEHHQQFLNEINHGIQGTSYDDDLRKFHADRINGKESNAVGLHHSYGHGGHLTSHY